MEHPWCSDIERDTAVRAAEDAAASPVLPMHDIRALVAELRERVGRLEAWQITKSVSGSSAEVPENKGGTMPAIDPGPGWRLLADDEVIEEGDEWLAAPAYLNVWKPTGYRGGGATPRKVGETYRRRVEAKGTQPAPVPPSYGLRKERVTLEIKQRADRYLPLSKINWGAMWRTSCGSHPGESVRVVEEATIGSGDVFADVGCGSTGDEIARLTAERDAALRERDEAKKECALLWQAIGLATTAVPGSVITADDPIGMMRRVAARVAELERERRPATWQEEEAAVEGAWLLCGLEPDWPSDEPGTIVRHAESMRREIARLRARVAELERERDAAKKERERLRVQFARLSGVVRAYVDCPGQVRGGAYRDLVGTLDWIDGRNDPDGWPSVVSRLEDQRDSLKARVAELEAAAAPAANAGVVSNPEQISGGGKSNCQEKLDGSQEPVAWGVKTHADWLSGTHYRTEREARDNCPTGGTVVPLFAAPQPPRGWLTEEEREAVEKCLRHFIRQEIDFLERNDPGHRWLEVWRQAEVTLSALLARSTPPLVKVPSDAPPHRRRDDQWIAAIREAGGEVE